jgi:hypothetical protein
MVEMPNLVKEFYQERMEDDLSFMRYLQADAGKMQELREANPEDWEIEELTRHIIFLEAQTIEGLKGEIENDREDLKKLG